jgi:hypothetical protein
MDNLQIWRKLRKISLDDTECKDRTITLTEHCTLLGKRVVSITIPENEEEIQIKFDYIDSPIVFTVENLPHDEFRFVVECMYYELKHSYVIGDFEDDFLPMCH